MEKIVYTAPAAEAEASTPVRTADRAEVAAPTFADSGGSSSGVFSEKAEGSGMKLSTLS